MNIHSTENNLSNLLDKNEQALYLFRSKILLILLQKQVCKLTDFSQKKQLSTPSALVISVLNFMGG